MGVIIKTLILLRSGESAKSAAIRIRVASQEDETVQCLCPSIMQIISGPVRVVSRDSGANDQVDVTGC